MDSRIIKTNSPILIEKLISASILEVSFIRRTLKTLLKTVIIIFLRNNTIEFSNTHLMVNIAFLKVIKLV